MMWSARRRFAAVQAPRPLARKPTISTKVEVITMPVKPAADSSSSAAPRDYLHAVALHVFGTAREGCPRLRFASFFAGAWWPVRAWLFTVTATACGQEGRSTRPLGTLLTGNSAGERTDVLFSVGARRPLRSETSYLRRPKGGAPGSDYCAFAGDGS